MRPAPVANPDEFGTADDEIMADPLSDEMVELWQKTAKVNREVFTELFRPVPTNLVRDWDAYNVRFWALFSLLLTFQAVDVDEHV